VVSSFQQKILTSFTPHGQICIHISWRMIVILRYKIHIGTLNYLLKLVQYINISDITAQKCLLFVELELLLFEALSVFLGLGFDGAVTTGMDFFCHEEWKIEKWVRGFHHKRYLKTIRIITSWGTAEEEGGGASQMQRGIPHLHSLTPDARLLSAVGFLFESTFASISNSETASVMLFTPSEEVCRTSFPDLCQRKFVMYKWFLNNFDLK
jgi:hypothetical protein